MTTTFTGRDYRITFLTERLVRLEYQPDGLFEDRPTTCVRFRDFPPVKVDVRQGIHGLELDRPISTWSIMKSPSLPAD